MEILGTINEGHKGISVIIPVYNVKPFLRECIDSVINQTYKDLEIIIIDDGSTDGSGTVCDEYTKDLRVIVIHQNNRGLSAARNAGLDIATKDYIMFVDSDDWVDPEFCEIPYNTAVLHGADIVYFDYWQNKDERSEEKRTGECEGIKDSQTAMKLLFNGVGVTVWNKLFRKHLFETVRFPVGTYFEDSVTTPTLVHTAQKVYYKKTPLYHYRYREGSIVTMRDQNIMEERIEQLLERIRILKEWGYPSERNESIISLLWSYLLSFGGREKYSQVCKAYIVEHGGLGRSFSWRSKAMWYLLKYSPAWFDYLCIVTGCRDS